MKQHRHAPEVEAELDGIWYHIATKSGSVEIADRVIENITERFWLLARNPHIGRRRDDDLRPGLRSTLRMITLSSIAIENDGVLILHVVHENRDIQALFSE